MARIGRGGLTKIEKGLEQFRVDLSDGVHEGQHILNDYDDFCSHYTGDFLFGDSAGINYWYIARVTNLKIMKGLLTIGLAIGLS